MNDLSLAAHALSDVTTEVFAVNGALLRAGDTLSAAYGLSSARWQVLGLLREGPRTVAQLARERGLRRQAVQQTVSRLVAEEQVRTEPNPDDGRAPLVVLTGKGAYALDRLEPAERDWLESIAASLDAADLLASVRVLRALRGRLVTDAP